MEHCKVTVSGSSSTTLLPPLLWMVCFHKALWVFSRARSEHSKCWSHVSLPVLLVTSSFSSPLSCVPSRLHRDREKSYLEMTCPVSSLAVNESPVAVDCLELQGPEIWPLLALKLLGEGQRNLSLTHVTASGTNSSMLCICSLLAPKSHGHDRGGWCPGPSLFPERKREFRGPNLL